MYLVFSLLKSGYSEYNVVTLEIELSNFLGIAVFACSGLEPREFSKIIFQSVLSLLDHDRLGMITKVSLSLPLSLQLVLTLQRFP